ncbi:hypothetical protein FHG87_025190 [Trinorchestia longiramus]|nr:hypothetical protein FHG87_025190 [Trinorchestia longiramus]
MQVMQVMMVMLVMMVMQVMQVMQVRRRLALMCDSDQAEKDWSAEIRKAKRHHGEQRVLCITVSSVCCASRDILNCSFLTAADFCNGANKHGSFAPQRQGAMANWYVDGNRYMWDVADAIDQAREEVFITDWWLSPDIYMKRPDLTATRWK